jgi:uncharacterized membrane protein
MKKAITQETVDLIVGKRDAGTPASKLPEELGLPSSTVNVVLSAKGLTKARPEVLERDQKRLASWMAADRVAESRPAEPIASKTASERVTRTAVASAQRLSEKVAAEQKKQASAEKKATAAKPRKTTARKRTKAA